MATPPNGGGDGKEGRKVGLTRAATPQGNLPSCRENGPVSRLSERCSPGGTLTAIAYYVLYHTNGFETTCGRLFEWPSVWFPDNVNHSVRVPGAPVTPAY